MRITNRNAALACFALAAGALALGGCQEDARTAQWYMAHGPELKDKLAECRKYPSLNHSDPNCKAANDAFATLVTASAHESKDRTPPDGKP